MCVCIYMNMHLCMQFCMYTCYMCLYVCKCVSMHAEMCMWNAEIGWEWRREIRFERNKG